MPHSCNIKFWLIKHITTCHIHTTTHDVCLTNWSVTEHCLGIMNRSNSIAEHIANHLGPQQALPLAWLTLLTVVYVVILVSGLVGNCATILVIFRFRYMQTITNLYLCNLAITDLISLMLSKYCIKHKNMFNSNSAATKLEREWFIISILNIYCLLIVGCSFDQCFHRFHETARLLLLVI